MRQQRSGLESAPQLPASRAPHAPLFNGHSVNLLLSQEVGGVESAEPANAPPMHGIWTGIALGIVLWCAIAGVLLFTVWG